MTPDAAELAELQHALLRARAMGFDRTALAMQRVLDEMLRMQGHLRPTGETVLSRECALQ